jgi:hypothetical protein
VRGSLAISGVTAATDCCKVILALNDAFHFRFEIRYAVMSAVLQYIGRDEDAAKYHYIVGFFNDALLENLAVSHWSRSNLEDLGEVSLFLESA